MTDIVHGFEGLNADLKFIKEYRMKNKSNSCKARALRERERERGRERIDIHEDREKRE